MNKKQFYFLSGLPRSGSTLLSSILSQNENIYAGGNSPVCQLMWDMQSSIYTNSYQQIMANNNLDVCIDLIKSIPDLYYKNISENIIIDKCRSWTLESNINLIKNYVTDSPKIIILIRPIEEIINSFCSLYEKNNRSYDINVFLTEWSEPIMRSYEGIIQVIENQEKENYLIISYDDLINNTKKSIEKIYDFFDLEYYNHDYNNIVNKHKENDLVYNLEGMHIVRKTISRRKIKNYLNENTLNKCMDLNNNLKKKINETNFIINLTQ
jgi:sulfotransferase